MHSFGCLLHFTEKKNQSIHPSQVLKSQNIPSKSQQSNHQDVCKRLWGLSWQCWSKSQVMEATHGEECFHPCSVQAAGIRVRDREPSESCSFPGSQATDWVRGTCTMWCEGSSSVLRCLVSLLRGHLGAVPGGHWHVFQPFKAVHGRGIQLALCGSRRPNEATVRLTLAP